MLIIEGENVYRLDRDQLETLLGYSEFEDMVLETQVLTEQVGEGLAEDCISEIEFHLRLRKARLEDPDLNKAYQVLFNAMWARFKKDNDDITEFLVDMKPEEVTHNVHHEPNLGYNVDTGESIDCADCMEKTEEYLAWVERAKEAKKNKIDPESEEFQELIDSYPEHFGPNPWKTNPLEELIKELATAMEGGEGPGVGVYRLGPDGLVEMDQEELAELGLDSPEQEFDENMPAVTHQVSRRLN